jgi:hypothetical protein
VLHNDVRIAWNEPLHVIGGKPGIEIVRAAGRMPEQDRDGFALVELLRRLGGGRRHRIDTGNDPQCERRQESKIRGQCFLLRDRGAIASTNRPRGFCNAYVSAFALPCMAHSRGTLTPVAMR